MALFTEQEKSHAVQALKKRQEENKNKKRIDNSSLYAGSPMYYYCRLCFLHIATLPETHDGPSPKYCDDCQELLDAGWSESEKRFIDYVYETCKSCRGSGKTSYRDYYTKRPRNCSECHGEGKIKKRMDAIAK